jgi:hypothetical protein
MQKLNNQSSKSNKPINTNTATQNTSSRQEVKQAVAAALVGVPSFLIKTYDIVNVSFETKV